MPTKITNITQLKKAVKGGQHEFFIDLGGIRSSKHIEYDDERNMFLITNEIDSSQEDLTPKEIFDDKITHIGTAILAGNFYSNN